MLFRFCLFANRLLIENTNGKEESDVTGPVYKALDIILPVALGVILLCGLIYSIVIGVQYSKAEDANARNATKKKLINAIIGFGLVLILVAILYAIRKPIGDFISSKS